MAKFNLKSGNTTPFKMMGSSPMKDKTYLDIGGKEVFASGSGSSVNISGGKGKKPLSTFTLAPGISVGKLNLAGKYKGGFKTDETGKSTGKKFIGGSGRFSVGSRNPRTYSPSFKGSISGEYGTTKHPTGKKTKGYSGRASLGIGRSGSSFYEPCPSGGCGANVTGYNIKAFGEHGSKGSYNPGTRVGLSGRYGPVSGEASYNIKTKKPEFKFGISLPINK